MPASYDPTWESIDSHPVPDWFDDAKLGIFIHWGPYSVPGWAPLGNYAEWYPYGMYQEDSDHREYHAQEWGADVEYADFIDMWDAENWDPDAWASLFSSVGARYVVMTGEHHDGFPLWDTHYTKYNAANMGPERDLVGDLCRAVRDAGMRFSASYHANLNYYQPGYDGSFGHPDYHATTVEDADPGQEYVDFMNAKHREIIRKYEPDLLWFDVPRADGDQLHAQELIVEYYERAATDWDKEVVVNDRSAADAWGHHGDFVTPEYDMLDSIKDEKWEMCRGVGDSFGFNRAEGADDHLSGAALVEMFVDIVSKNGNLLINVGPRADGTIPELQRKPLETLGGWLSDHDEAIYGTRPWAVAVDETTEFDVRYTWKDDTLFVHFFENPSETVELGIGEHASTGSLSTARTIGTQADVPLSIDDDIVTLEISDECVDELVTTIALSDVANPRQNGS